MNKNSEKIAIGSFMALMIILVITAILMTAEHFEWIETNWFGGTVEQTGISILTDDTDSLNIMYKHGTFGTPEINFDENSTGVYEYDDSMHGITVTTSDGEVYTFYEKVDGSWIRRIE